MSFFLAPTDVALLQENIPVIQAEIADIIQSNLRDFKPIPVVWKWANVSMRR